jgi:uncharacterized protein YegP (UPF0339 family)
MTDDSTGIIEVLPAASGGYFWHLKGRNGEIVASSGSETFEHPTDARAAARRACEIAQAPRFADSER